MPSAVHNCSEGRGGLERLAGLERLDRRERPEPPEPLQPLELRTPAAV
ncbi:hypothetical protein ACFXA3_07035 [Streptomyces sp. NPDC059456]